MRLRIVLLLSLGLVVVLLLAACGGGREDGRRLQVVAAESAYGSIAALIGGRHVAVTAILSSPNADPHLFEPDPATALRVADARVVIQNGLGYDAFMTRLEDATPSKRRIVLTMANVLGVQGADANPHLWYDVPQLGRIANSIAGALVRADPSHAAAYRKGLHHFHRSLVPLRREVARIRARYAGAAVAYTEPVPGYLVAAAGLRNLSSTAFARAIEDGSEPTPGAFAAMDGLVARRRIRVLLYNDQTVSPITKLLVGDARRNGIRVVPVSETLPPRVSLPRWELHETQELARALAS